MKHKITPDAIQKGRSLKARVVELIHALALDEAVPVDDICAEFGISQRHLRDILREQRASMHLLIQGKSTVCVVNPKTAEKHNAKR